MNIPHPMLVSDMNNDMLEGMLADPMWGMERKRDGMRCEVRLENGKIKVLNRYLKAMILPDVIKQRLLETKFLSSDESTLVLDGELTWICKDDKDHRTEKQAGPGARPVFAVWDILLDKKDDNLLERKKYLIKLARNNHWTNSSCVEAQSMYVQETSKRRVFKTGGEEDWEGYVFKRLDVCYTSGKGNWAYRYKYKVTDDYIVIGYTESDKDKNPFRALVLGMYDTRGNLIRKGQCGGGFPDKKDDTEKPTRNEIHEKYLKGQSYWKTLKDGTKQHNMGNKSPHKWKSGKKCTHKMTDKDYKKTYGNICWLWPKDWFVIEIESQKLTEYGIPYMAQFQALRDDKDIKDCVDHRSTK